LESAAAGMQGGIRLEAGLKKALNRVQAAGRFPGLKKSVKPTERYATLAI